MLDLIIKFLFVIYLANTSNGALTLPIDYIENRVVEIDHNLHSCVKTNILLSGSSTEGGSVTYYHASTGIRKITEETLGEMGKTITHYFYDHGNLIYVCHELFEYNRPIYWGKKQAIEAGDIEVFDFNKTVIHRSRYYFIEQQLIYGKDELVKLYTATSNDANL